VFEYSPRQSNIVVGKLLLLLVACNRFFAFFLELTPSLPRLASFLETTLNIATFSVERKRKKNNVST